jgi:hypothetical protein
MQTRLGLYLLLGTLVACGGESTKDTGSAATTGGTDGGDDGGDDGGEVTTGEGLFQVKNFFDGNGVADAEVASSLGSVTTDTDGNGNVPVPLGETFEVTIRHPSFFPVRFFGALPADPVDGTFVAEEFLVAAIVADQLAMAFGATVDADDGHMILSILTSPDGGRDLVPLAGAEISLDAGYDLSVVQDSAAPGGFATGTTSADGAIVLMNVPPGPVNLNVTPPDGYALCNMFPAANMDDQRDFAAEVSAASITRISVICWPG